jgi:hypothetical protein
MESRNPVQPSVYRGARQRRQFTKVNQNHAGTLIGRQSDEIVI